MRRGPEYRCAQCGDTSPFASTCVRCEVMMLDAFGNADPPLVMRRKLFTPMFWREARRNLYFWQLIPGWFSFHLERFIAHNSRRLWVYSVEWFQVHRTRRALRRGLRGHHPASKDSAVEWAHITGRVRLLDPVPGEPGIACRRIRKKPENLLEHHLKCGRFLVEGEGESMLVDEDFFRLVPPPGTSHRKPLIALRDGQRVRVYGPVESRSVAELGLGGSAVASGNTGYRGSGQAKVFVGGTGALVLIQPLEGPGK